jgi:acyl dehydratase
MKKILSLITLLLITVSYAHAQPVGLRNENLTQQYYAEGSVGKLSVDRYGVVQMKNVDPTSGLSQSVIPVSNSTGLNGTANSIVAYNNWEALTDTIEAGSTTTVLNLTAHAGRVGDVVLYRGTGANLGIEIPVLSVTANSVTLSKALPATPGLDPITFLRPVFIGATLNRTTGSSFGASLNTSIDFNTQYQASTGILKLEDAAAASGDALVGIAGVINNTLAAKAADGDYTSPSLDSAGATLNVIVPPSGLSSALSPTRLEDSAIADTQALMMAGARVKGDFNASAADGDAAHINVDLDGRLAVNPWGADTSETGQACGTATATTADVAIKAAVASNRIYYGSVTCKNTSATVATSIDFKDGATVTAVGGVSQMAAGASGSFSAQFNPPIRGSVNTAVNFATNVSTSSVTCCINWFTSGN